MLSTESVWSNQHTDRLAVARPAKRHVGLAVGKAVRSLIDQNAGECLPLRLMRRDGIVGESEPIRWLDGWTRIRVFRPAC